MPKLDEYKRIVGQSTINDLKLLSEKLQGKVIQHINSTSVGGGVAEILNRQMPLLKELGVDARWDLIKGGEQFFNVTKMFHNALHGFSAGPVEVRDEDFDVFLHTSSENIRDVKTYGDIMVIHDPQPIALIEKKDDHKWIWRCHVDVSNPNKKVWNFLRNFINKYDGSIFSAPNFSKNLEIRQFMIPPSIDPLSDKNKDLPAETIKKTFEKYQVPQDKPIITQVSRFDRLKDPVGVIQAYKQVKKYNDCRLVLAGGTAVDDPEGLIVLEEVKEAAKGDNDIHILLMPHNDIEVNALQRGSTIVLQKSLKEGFGLTVSEALWKAKPVVASNVGGIPLQIRHRYSGLLSHTIEGTALAIKQLLNSPDYARKLGTNGKEHIRNNYLITRHIRDYMLTFLALDHGEEVVVNL